MPQGLEIFNADGSLLFGTSQRLMRFVGFVDIPASNSGGSLSDARLASPAVPFYFTYAAMYDGGVHITFSGSSMYWARRTFKNGQLDTFWGGRVYYGVY